MTDASPELSLRDKMFSFEGRLRRRDYWLISFGLGLVVFFATEVLMRVVFGPEYGLFTGGFEAMNRRVADGLPYVLQELFAFVTIWPNLAMSAKRRHDRGKGAAPVISLLVVFWFLTIVQVPVMHVYADTLATMPFAAAYLIYSLSTAALSIYLFVIVGCLDGTPGPNRFGPSPKAAELPNTA
jgi:uncharacterized membrane protein YhaH (DUF805 family)